MIDKWPDELKKDRDIHNRLVIYELDNEKFNDLLETLHTFANTDWNVCENEDRFLNAFYELNRANLDDIEEIDVNKIKILSDEELKDKMFCLKVFEKEDRLAVVRWIWLVINANWIKDKKQEMLLALLNKTRFAWYSWHLFIK